jgi:hypothetical protein
VAIDGATVVAGAYGDDDAGSWSGSAYVFRTTDGGATYGQVAKLTASDGAVGDYFGDSVAIDGDTIVVGAYGRAPRLSAPRRGRGCAPRRTAPRRRRQK